MFLGKDILKICSKFIREHPSEIVISIKLQSNFIEITLRPGCSPVCSHEPHLEVICWIALIFITNLERYCYFKSVQRLLLIRAYNYYKLGHIYYKLGQLIQIGTIIANQSTTSLISGGDINCLCGKLSKVTLLIEFI